jgi:hypothetical protein
MRTLIRQLGVRDVRGSIVAVALIRPGPSEGGMKDAYLRRAAGEEAPHYPCPQVREVLEENHGVILYEEDVMCVAAAVTGMSLAEGDLLRSRLKKASGDALVDLENDFLRRAIARGVAPDAAAAVWKDLRRSSRYTFNKARRRLRPPGLPGGGCEEPTTGGVRLRAPQQPRGHVRHAHHRRARRSRSRSCVRRSERRHGVEDRPPGPAGEAAAGGGSGGFQRLRRRGRPAPRRAVRIGLCQVRALRRAAEERPRPAVPLARRPPPPHPHPRRELESLVLAGALDLPA